MPLAANALGATAAMKGRALEDGTAQDLGAMNELGSQFIPFLRGTIACYLCG